MGNTFKKIKELIGSSTAKDTFILFSGNLLSAFLGFVFTLIVARNLSVSDFGIFSAATNLVVILISLTDLGISSGAVNFISSNLAKKKTRKANEYMKAATILRLSATFLVSSIVAIFAQSVSVKFLATSDMNISYWVSLVTFFFAIPMLFPFFLQAKKKFISSIVVDNSLYLARLLVGAIFIYLGILSINSSLMSFVIGALVGSLVGLVLIKPKFLFTSPKSEVFKRLFRFSGWLGVNRIISSISGRLDIQMLAMLAGATQTGIYSIPSRLSGFVIVLASSFSGVLAPRLASFNDRKKEIKYIIKATIAMIPITIVLIVWAYFAYPFITILFGEKYIDSVFVFQCLVVSMIPFLFTAPSVTAIIYAIKKTVYIGMFSFFQITVIFILNYLLIPKFGALAPAITFAVTNTILLIYTWTIVVRHYYCKL